MANFALKPDDLRDSAGKYVEGSESIEQILSNLTKEQDKISDNWEGDAFKSFDVQFKELSPKINEFADLLKQINEQLKNVAKIVEDTDADIARQING